MTARERDIETLRLTWEMFIPDVPAPSEHFLGIWQHFLGDEIGLGIQAIEITAERHKKRPLENAHAYCWARLKNLIHDFLDRHKSTVDQV
jgi:hypothetical protein